MTFYTAGTTLPITQVVIMPITTTTPIIRAQGMAVDTTMMNPVNRGGNFGKESNS